MPGLAAATAAEQERAGVGHNDQPDPAPLCRPQVLMEHEGADWLTVIGSGKAGGITAA